MCCIARSPSLSLNHPSIPEFQVQNFLASSTFNKSQRTVSGDIRPGTFDISLSRVAKEAPKRKMSPANLHDQHAKSNNNNLVCPPNLKVNRESHSIKKSSSSSSSPPSSSSSSVSSLGNVISSKPPQRHPVIIYTHSPKVIHTHPKDFMALVQKLTGLSRSDDDQAHQVKSEKANKVVDEAKQSVKVIRSDNDSSSSVITEENYGSIGDGQGQVPSCFLPPIFEPPNPYMANIPVFTPNSADFLCTSQPFYNYTDSLFFTPPNLRTSVPSSTTLEGINEFREY